VHDALTLRLWSPAAAAADDRRVDAPRARDGWQRLLLLLLLLLGLLLSHGLLLLLRLRLLGCGRCLRLASAGGLRRLLRRRRRLLPARRLCAEAGAVLHGLPQAVLLHCNQPPACVVAVVVVVAR
jgi:hypothetical protein